MAPDSTLNPHNFNLFRRCVQCPSEQPSCPNCGPGETCQLFSKSCDNCAYTQCIKIGQLPGQIPEPSTSTPVAPIAGGVVGGIAALAAIVVVLWWFWWRPKKKAANAWQNEKRSTLRDRQSMHSRRSVASTVMTRASNVIQIAYIPGVTVRSPPESPGLPPPMPPLPGSAPGPNGTVIGPEQHFFMPSDLRGSTYSDTSTINNRISLSPSLARTTYYGGEVEEIPPVPAQHAFRAQANMVSVKSATNTPALVQGRSPLAQQTGNMANSSIVAKTAVARPIEIKKQGSAPRVPTLGNLAKQKSSQGTSFSASEKSVPLFLDEKEIVSPIESEKEVVSPKPSFLDGNTRASSVSGVSRVMPSDGPLSSSIINNHQNSESEGLNAMIEQALKDAAGSAIKRPQLKPQDSVKTSDSSPFSDAHEVHEIDSKENKPLHD